MSPSEQPGPSTLADLDAAALDLLPIGVTVYSSDGRVVRANSASEGLLGVSRKSHEGTSIGEIPWKLFRRDGSPMPPEEAPVTVALSTGRAVLGVELGLQREDGSMIWLDVCASPHISGGVIATYSDVTEHHREEAVRAARGRLAELSATSDLWGVLVATLDEIEALTNSTIGFLHFVDSDQSSLTLQAWSTRTASEFCRAEGRGLHYAVSEAGVWAEAIRVGRPVIHNDYATLPHRRGMPEGHTVVVRELVVPVIRGGKIVAVLGTGNKPLPYSESDIDVVQRFADLAWDIAEKKRAEEASHESDERFRNLITQSPLPKVVGSLDGNIRHVNKAFVRAFGYDENDIRTIDDWWEKLFPDEMYRERTKAEWARSYEEAKQTGRPTRLEYHIICKDGTERIVDRRGAVIGDSWVEVFNDVTESRRLEAELWISADRFKTLVNTSLDGYMFSVGGRIIDVNETLAHMLGYTVAEMRKMSVAEIEARERPSEVARHVERILRIGYDRFESAHRAKNGLEIPVEISAMHDRQRNGVLAFIRDLRQQKAAEAAVRESEQKFSHLFRVSTDALHLTELGTQKIVETNNVFETLTGYTRDEVIGHTTVELGLWADPEQRYEFFEQLREKGSVRGLEAEYVTREGRWFWGESSADIVEIGARQYVLSSTRDISERKRVEAQLRASEAQLRAAQRIARLGSWTWNRDSDKVTWSDEMYEITGHDRSSFVPTPDHVESLFGEPMLTSYREMLLRALDTGEASSLEGDLVRADGAVRKVHARGEALCDVSGRIIGVQGTIQDVTEQKLADEQIRETARFLRDAQRAGRVGTYLWDLRRDEWKSSPELDDIFGIDAAYKRDLHGWSELIDPEWRARMDAYVADIVARSLPFDQEYAIRRPSTGELRWVHGMGEFERDAEGTPIRLLGVIQDVTERKKVVEELSQMREQLLHAQKMESLGLLAGGVAHDINNVLAAILGLATAYADMESAGSPLRDALDSIASACVRGRTTVRALLGFARKELAEERVVDLNGVIADEIKLLERTTLRKIGIIRDLEPSLWPIKGDPGALSHALMNVCVNAVDAMQGGGELTIRTRNVEPSMVELSVSDTGPGMPPEVVERAFDPFFTTKAQGEGTGLGLSIVYGTVRAHGGQVWIESAPGEGTRVIMRLPAQAAATTPEPARTPDSAATTSRSLRILLVDDDSDVRQTMELLLSRLKHRVTAASSGEEALEMIENGAECDLVLLDLSMPGIGGAGTLKRLRASGRELPVLIATGLADQRAIDLTQIYANVTLLQKPFTLLELRSALEGVAVAGV